MTKRGIFMAAASVLALAAAPAGAEVRRIIIDKKVSPAFDGAAFGPAGQYETISGRVYGELDPRDRRNAIIQDLKLARKDAAGRVERTVSREDLWRAQTPQAFRPAVLREALAVPGDATDEATLAERLGKETAVFAPTGTQSNLLGLMSHCERGDECCHQIAARGHADLATNTAWHRRRCRQR